jgi:hypothetical protein
LSEEKEGHTLDGGDLQSSGRQGWIAWRPNEDQDADFDPRDSVKAGDFGERGLPILCWLELRDVKCPHKDDIRSWPDQRSHAVKMAVSQSYTVQNDIERQKNTD